MKHEEREFKRSRTGPLNIDDVTKFERRELDRRYRRRARRIDRRPIAQA